MPPRFRPSRKGFAPAGGDARYAAFDDAAHGVFVAQGVVDRGVEPCRIGLAADGGQLRGEGRTAEYFFFATTPAATSASVNRPEKWRRPAGRSTLRT